MRSLIERIFEKMKHKILRVPFKGTPEQFRHIFNTVGGSVNRVRAFNEIAGGAGLRGSPATERRGTSDAGNSHRRDSIAFHPGALRSAVSPRAPDRQIAQLFPARRKHAPRKARH